VPESTNDSGCIAAPEPMQGLLAT